jgi:hypothetical protein
MVGFGVNEDLGSDFNNTTIFRAAKAASFLGVNKPMRQANRVPTKSSTALLIPLKR